MNAPAYNPASEELHYVAGDQPVVREQSRSFDQPGAIRDPSGASNVLGHQSSVRLDKSALGHPYIRYRDMVIEADVFPFLDGGMDADGDQTRLEVLLLCPQCRRQLRVTSDRKRIEWIPGQPEIDLASQTAITRGVISIEKFQCTWEKDITAAVTGHGENLCRWRVVVDKGIARDV